MPASPATTQAYFVFQKPIESEKISLVLNEESAKKMVDTEYASRFQTFAKNNATEMTIDDDEVNFGNTDNEEESHRKTGNFFHLKDAMTPKNKQNFVLPIITSQSMEKIVYD